MKLQASCNVTVSIESHNSIEQAVLEGAKEAGKKLFLAFLELIKRRLSRNRICDCGGRLESRGRVNRELMSIVGDILFNSQKLRCLNCGKENYPLDEVLGIWARRLVTLGLRGGGEDFVIEAQRYGVFDSKEVIFVGDGASSCQ